MACQWAGQPVSGGSTEATATEWEVVVASGSKYRSFGVAHHGTNVSGAWPSFGFDSLGWGRGYTTSSGCYSHAASLSSARVCTRAVTVCHSRALATGQNIQVGSVVGILFFWEAYLSIEDPLTRPVGILLTAERTLRFWHDGSFVGAHPLRVGNDAALPLYSDRVLHCPLDNG
jgi:hypothetical protein